jgi:predicted Rossmann fold nucleotide-binding protein DprA/Smf involved in DNA uptake
MTSLHNHKPQVIPVFNQARVSPAVETAMGLAWQAMIRNETGMPAYVDDQDDGGKSQFQIMGGKGAQARKIAGHQKRMELLKIMDTPKKIAVLAEEMGVTKTNIREMIYILHNDGLVQSFGGHAPQWVKT